MKNATAYKNRYIAQIDIEAVTPLAIGSGEKSILTDSLVIKDVNGLPYIPGTSIAGVIRSALAGLEIDDLFGFHDKKGGQGSKIIFSDGRLIGKSGKPVDGICPSDIDESERHFLEQYESLPVRQHVRISESGAAAAGGKFDEQIVFKGSRFRFEIELRSDTDENESFLMVLDALSYSDFRLGGGTRSGFGKVRTVSCVWRAYDLENVEDRDAYLSKSSSLVDALDGVQYNPKTEGSDSIVYRLRLRPADFLLIGSGFSDDEADMTPVSEPYITWEDGKASFNMANVVIPATSLKGALAHRTAYHFNKITQRSLDKEDIQSLSSLIGDSNPAVACLFGTSSEAITRGKTLFDDIIMSSEKTDPFVLNHTSVDRFTGGVKDGALFQEKALFSKDEILETEIMLTDIKNIKSEYISAFEKALGDLCDGLLPLGGGTNRGNGCFAGELFKNGKLL